MFKANNICIVETRGVTIGIKADSRGTIDIKADS